MEASVHGPFDKSLNSPPRIYQNWRMKLFATLPLLLAIALIGYAVSHPEIVKSVAEGMLDQFTSADASPDIAPTKRMARH